MTLCDTINKITYFKNKTKASYRYDIFTKPTFSVNDINGFL